jgi:filamentous hemagglutinin
VWLVTRTVTAPDGSTVRALVPQVYVAVREGDIDGTGTLISANAIDLTLGGDLSNSGTIAGRQLVQVSGQNITNLGGRISGGVVNLDSAIDINNIGGRIEASSAMSSTSGNANLPLDLFIGRLRGGNE